MGSFAGKAGKDKTPRRPGRHAAALVLATLLAASPGAGQVAPDADWRTLDTPHFSVTFPAGLEDLARHAAARAEQAWDGLSRVLPQPDPGRIELLLTGDVDLSNGLASVSPARRIVVYLRPPVDGYALAHFDDWLDLVITHELAHVFHLDVTGPLGNLLRRVFGRLPVPWPLFPGRGTPAWTTEGLATWYESEFTGVGRTGGTFFEMMLRTAALEGEFAPIDRASGISPQWPGGETAYLYGSLFFDHLLEKYGADRMVAFVRAVGGQWIPYRLNAAAREAFGVGFSQEWEAWAAEWTARARDRVAELEASGGVTRPEILTRDARLAVSPRVAPDGTVAFARADGRSDPQLRVVEEGGEGTRFLHRTHDLARFDWAPDASIVYAQLEFQDPYRIFSDLWRRHSDGRVERLTRGERLDQPTVSPDGRRVVAVQYEGAGSRLVGRALDGGRLDPLTPADGTWAFPSYSPDGLWIAASRWGPEGVDVVVLNAHTGELALQVTRDRAVDLAPTWAPDSRTLLWVSDRSGIPQVVGARIDPSGGRVEPLRQVTRVLSGAAFPEVDPAGRWLYFSLYTSRGWEMARIPYDPAGWTEPPPLDSRFEGVGAHAEPAAVEGTVREYASLPSLRPRFWQPLYLPGESTVDGDLLKPFVGLGSWSSDLVGRHSIRLRGAISLSGEELNGRLDYAYAGLGNPVLDFRAEQEWDGEGPFEARRDSLSPLENLYVLEREQRVSLGATVNRIRWNSALALAGRAGMVWESRRLLDARFVRPEAFALRQPESRLAEGQLSLAFSTARQHALSISPEEGVTAFVLARVRREQALADTLVDRPGWDRSNDQVLGQVKLYQSFRGPGFADHVVALRAAGGAARGPGADALTFEVGGTAGASETVTGLGLFGGYSTFFPVRGYRRGDRSGRYAWVGSAEYRFPLARVNRGPGLFPLHLDALSGGVFVDAGNAWGPELGIPGFQQPRGTTLWSAGGEISARLTAFFNLALVVRTGVAFPGVDVPGGTSPTWYVRLGPSF